MKFDHLKEDDPVLVVSGRNRFSISRRVSRVTSTQIIVMDDDIERRFRKKDGYEVGKGKTSHWTPRVHLELVDSEDGQNLLRLTQLNIAKSKLDSAYHAWSKDRDDAKALQELAQRAQVLEKLLDAIDA